MRRAVEPGTEGQRGHDADHADAERHRGGAAAAVAPAGDGEACPDRHRHRRRDPPVARRRDRGARGRPVLGAAGGDQRAEHAERGDHHRPGDEGERVGMASRRWLDLPPETDRVARRQRSGDSSGTDRAEHGAGRRQRGGQRDQVATSEAEGPQDAQRVGRGARGAAHPDRPEDHDHQRGRDREAEQRGRLQLDGPAGRVHQVGDVDHLDRAPGDAVDLAADLGEAGVPAVDTHQCVEVPDAGWHEVGLVRRVERVGRRHPAGEHATPGDPDDVHRNVDRRRVRWRLAGEQCGEDVGRRDPQRELVADADARLARRDVADGDLVGSILVGLPALQQHGGLDRLTRRRADAGEVVAQLGVIDDLDVGDGEALQGADTVDPGDRRPVEVRIVGHECRAGDADPRRHAVDRRRLAPGADERRQHDAAAHRDERSEEDGPQRMTPGVVAQHRPPRAHVPPSATRPSRIATTRPAAAAIAGSWVTSTIV